MRRIVLQILLAASICAVGRARIIYVDRDANGPGDGLSWETPYRYLQDALADADSGEKPVEIRVARGVYSPDEGALLTPGDREASFHLSDGVALIGGYAGLSADYHNGRDIDLYETILSGDLQDNDAVGTGACDLHADPTRADNSSRIIHMTGSSTCFSAMLDGFTIRSANGASALYLSTPYPSVKSCTFINNASAAGGGAVEVDNGEPEFIDCTFACNTAGHGGAIHTALHARGGGGGESMTGSIRGCTFLDNYATETGGAVLLGAGVVDIRNCVFTRNSARLGGALYSSRTNVENCLFFCNNAAEQGGGAYLVGGQASNCLFVRNSAVEGGGGIYFPPIYGVLSVSRSTFVANESAQGRAISSLHYLAYSFNASAVITSTIFRDGGNEIYAALDEIRANTIVAYSNIEGGWPGEDNIDADPLFANPSYWSLNGPPDDPNDDVFAVGDYHLKSQAGRWDPIYEGWVIDDVTSPCIDAGDPTSTLGDEPFPHGGRINMGAYAGTAEASKSYTNDLPAPRPQ